MSNFRFELDSAGVRALLRSEGAQQVCAEKAREVLARCPDGYETDTFTGKNRVNAMVWPATGKAMRDNAENNTLLKALR